MILLETSAVVCGLQNEPGADRLWQLLDESKVVAIGSTMVVEAGAVLTARGQDGQRLMQAFLRDSGAEVLDCGREHAELAISAFSRFGKGRHKARLNFGDCMSYAFARVSGLSLVYTGDDFGQTDLERLVRLD